MSVELVKRTQATILALAKTIEALDSDRDLQSIVNNAMSTTAKPPENVRYATAAITACMEFWIMSGYYTRDQLIEVASIICNSLKPLPEGPTRSNESARS